jgi:hypothetical protein
MPLVVKQTHIFHPRKISGQVLELWCCKMEVANCDAVAVVDWLSMVPNVPLNLQVGNQLFDITLLSLPTSR